MMDHIDEDKFNSAKELPAVKSKSDSMEITKQTDEEFDKMLTIMANPVDAQRDMAVKLKHYIEAQMEHELNTKGHLSDHTRRWIVEYNKLLTNIHTALYGNKSVNLHLHKVSHSDIATKVREAKQVGTD